MSMNGQAALPNMEIRFWIQPVEAKHFPHKYFHNIEYKQADLTNLPYNDEKFDKVFCVSVLEHLDSDTMRKSFVEFKRVLKADGLIILTFDYPNINLESLQQIVEELGLEFAGNVSFERPENALYTDMYGGLNCFCSVLRKKQSR